MDAGYCREQALVEPLAGTAKPGIQRWILVEDGRRWPEKVPRDSELPEDVRARLAQIDADPHSRVQMIRRPGCGQGDRRQVFVVDSPEDPKARRVVQVELGVMDVASLDPRALIERSKASEELAELWLVCTHGNRDRCCAKWGMALWEGLRKHDPERVWQCSHLGGHRFAPTFLALPSGLLWGRFELDAVPGLVAELTAGRVGALDKLRGRSCYPQAAQLVEIELRQREGWSEDTQLQFLAAKTLESGSIEVRFETPGGILTRVVEPREESFLTPSNCGDEPSVRKTFRIRARA